jgi:hypothetical protein
MKKFMFLFGILFLISLASSLENISSFNTIINNSGVGSEGDLISYAQKYNLSWADFNGADSYGSFPYSSIFNGTNISISAWAKSAGANPGDAHIVRTSSDEWGMGTSNNYIVCNFRNSSNSLFTTPILAMPSEWHHYVCTRNASHLILYVDALVNKSIAFPDTLGNRPASAGNLWIGYEGASTRYFNGSIDTLRIYNEQLSENKIKELYFNGRDNEYNYNINETIITPSCEYIEVGDDDRVYCIHNVTDGDVEIYDINAGTFSTIGENKGSAGLFIDSQNNVFSSYGNNLSRYDNSTGSWTSHDIFLCKGVASGVYLRHQGMTEDLSGNLWLGEYTYGDGTERCGYVYKSSDNGQTWELSLNASAYGFNTSRHIHILQTDPYTGDIYATTGDPLAGYDANSSKLFKYNGSWNLLYSGDVDYQFLSVGFTPEYVFFGTDSQSDNKIYRMNKTTEILESVLVVEGLHVRSISVDSNNRIYAGTSASSNRNAGIYMSENNGDSWIKIKQIGNETTSTETGVFLISKFDSNDRAFYYDNLNNETSMIFNLINDTTILFLKFNEVNNTNTNDDGSLRLYDSSTNGFTTGILNGTLSLQSSNLTNISAYNFDFTLGIIKTLDTRLLNSYINIFYGFLPEEEELDPTQEIIDSFMLMFVFLGLLLLIAGAGTLIVVFTTGDLDGADLFKLISIIASVGFILVIAIYIVSQL